MSLALDVIDDRYNADDWEVEGGSPLWTPDCKFFLGGEGYGTSEAISSAPGRMKMPLVGEPTLHRYLGRNFLYFNGVDQYGRQAEDFTCGTTGTASLWVRFDDLGDSYYGAFFLHGYDRSGMFSIGHQGSGAGGRFTLSGASKAVGGYSPGVFHHMVLTWDDSNWAAYQDAVQLFDEAHGQALSPITDKDLILAAYRPGSTTNRHADCWIGDVAYFDTRFSLPQIRQLASLRPDLDGWIVPTGPRYLPAATAGGAGISIPVVRHHLQQQGAA